jgi:hypothetical protein
LMYADTTKLSITALNESSALTLLSSDVKSIAGSLSYLSEIYGASFEVKSAMSLLYNSWNLLAQRLESWHFWLVWVQQSLLT